MDAWKRAMVNSGSDKVLVAETLMTMVIYACIIVVSSLYCHPSPSLQELLCACATRP
jgi:hypothetical protein